MPGDKERLDWLEQQAREPGGLMLHAGSKAKFSSGLSLRPCGTNWRTLRQAIDLAMGSKCGKESVFGRYRLVPIDPPITLLPHLTSFDSVHWMDERDQNVILERLRTRWASILDALAPPDMQQAPRSEGNERRARL